MVHKLDALLWALSLEIGTGNQDKQQSIRAYCSRVICNLSDQGVLTIQHPTKHNSTFNTVGSLAKLELI